ncbi:hypothetical protein L218DRAFT_476921 [Marasmius fiardii PR-910]|nr:hypothetical protein L218DRAFT_476921 [Marasmius fiardii PR-910]
MLTRCNVSLNAAWQRLRHNLLWGTGTGGPSDTCTTNYTLWLNNLLKITLNFHSSANKYCLANGIAVSFIARPLKHHGAGIGIRLTMYVTLRRRCVHLVSHYARVSSILSSNVIPVVAVSKSLRKDHNVSTSQLSRQTRRVGANKSGEMKKLSSWFSLLSSESSSSRTDLSSVLTDGDFCPHTPPD